MLPIKDFIRLLVIRLRYCFLTNVKHMDIDKSALVSFGTKDVPSNCIVAGNPARIIRQGISTAKYGQLKK